MRAILTEQSAGLCRLVMQPSPPGVVCVDREALQTLETALDRVTRLPGCRILVLEGAPGSFCAGMDLHAAGEGDGHYEREIAAFAGCLTRLRGLSQAVVGVVDGPALGGGVALACACDLVIATSRAAFQLPELSLGLIPAMVLPFLLERLSPAQARWLCLTGASLAPEPARALGLVDELCADAAAAEARLELLCRRLGRCRPEAVARLKRQLEDLGHGARSADVVEGASRTAGHVAEPGVLEAIRGLAQGEVPPWFESSHRHDSTLGGLR